MVNRIKPEKHRPLNRWCCPEKCLQQLPKSVMLSGKVSPVGSQSRFCCPEKCPQQVPRSVVLSGKVPPAGSQTRFCCPEKCLHQNPEKSRKGVKQVMSISDKELTNVETQPIV